MLNCAGDNTMFRVVDRDKAWPPMWLRIIMAYAYRRSVPRDLTPLMVHSMARNLHASGPTLLLQGREGDTASSRT